MDKAELELVNDMANFADDPYSFVLYSFPWGSGELAEHEGPDTWQKEILCLVRDRLRSGMAREQAIQVAVASGHGVGKSSLVAWLILWAMSTMEDTRGVVTANTEVQLRTKTWAELAKWYRLCITKHWFRFTATALYSADPEHEKTWRMDMVPWSEHHTEAFAGLHNQGKRVLLIFDEASAIPDSIWEVSEGALTDENTEIFWFAFGNPTRNTGRFHACFHKLRHLWLTKQVDGRTAKLTNKAQIQTWIDTYGIDHDFVKVRVLGQFPDASDIQFIPTSLVAAARGKHLRPDQYNFAPKIIGVDPAWEGDDEFVIGLRQGLAFRILATYAKNDNDITMAGYIAQFEDEHQADAVFVDMGYGTGIVSAGRTMGRNWTLVSFAAESNDPGYLNKRAEMWGKMKEWLREGGAIPDDQVLCDDLIGPEYEVRLDGKIQLESKKDMKARGLASPNRADALALTFAYPVVPRAHVPRDSNGLHFAQTKYDIFRKR